MSEETIINGIDVSEEIRYCNNCSNLGLDFKARKFYCSLSHRPDELPEVLSCDEFSTNCYIKRLQEENEKLKEELAILQQENEDIAEARMEICNQCGNRDDYNIPCKMIRDLDYGLNVTIEERDNYEQALEKIREMLMECSTNANFLNNCSKSCKFYKNCNGELSVIQNKIDEVLNDRD